MSFSSVFEIIKIIAAISGLVVLVVACIAVISVIIVFSSIGLGNLVRERTNYISAEDLKRQIQSVREHHLDMPDWINCLYQVECIIETMLTDKWR